MKHLAVISYHSSPLIEPGVGDAGGMTVYVRAVAQTLARWGVRTDIFTRSEGTVTSVDHISPGVRVVSVPAGPPGALSKERAAAFIDDFVDGILSFADSHSVDYDLIHSHYWQSGLAGLTLAEALTVPLVHSHHTLARVKNGFLAPGDHPEPDARIAGEQRVIHEAGVLIASTTEEWEQLARLYKASHERVKTIYPGVDHGRFLPGDRTEARAELGLPQDAAILLCVGRIQPLKGLDLAVEALEELSSALDRDVLLVLVGGSSGAQGPPEEQRIRRLAAELGVADCVMFAGGQPHERTPHFYRAADLVAVCSYSESFGLSALEAHACGIPLIGTDVGALSHMIRDGRSGFLIDERDASVFAARAKPLLSDSDMWDDFSRAAIRSASAFTWERTAGDLVELYECLITERFPEACTC
ncbi:MAG: glycosyltransferase [Actinomycetota bacterium]